ncbi:MAG TPA: MaoC family dehydratase N-terminal domain-containing protein [Actinomycetota bacterium]
MPLNYDLKGKEYNEVSFTVDRDHVIRFCEAIGEDNPVFRDPAAAKAAGYDEQIAPPTFITALQIQTSGQVVMDQELGLNYSMVVHGEQEYEYTRPLKVGETLRAMPRIADVYSRGPNEFLITEADVRDESGNIVCVARSTILSRGTAAQ